MKVGALRKLHRDLGSILASYDASCGEQAQDNPPATPGTPRAPVAEDSAHDVVQSQAAFNRNVKAQETFDEMLSTNLSRLGAAPAPISPSHFLAPLAKKK